MASSRLMNHGDICGALAADLAVPTEQTSSLSDNLAVDCCATDELLRNGAPRHPPYLLPILDVLV